MRVWHREALELECKEYGRVAVSGFENTFPNQYLTILQENQTVV